LLYYHKTLQISDLFSEISKITHIKINKRLTEPLKRGSTFLFSSRVLYQVSHTYILHPEWFSSAGLSMCGAEKVEETTTELQHLLLTEEKKNCVAEEDKIPQRSYQNSLYS